MMEIDGKHMERSWSGEREENYRVLLFSFRCLLEIEVKISIRHLNL
jgi:hypothetical protein